MLALVWNHRRMPRVSDMLVFEYVTTLHSTHPRNLFDHPRSLFDHPRSLFDHPRSLFDHPRSPFDSKSVSLSSLLLCNYGRHTKHTAALTQHPHTLHIIHY
jgi:hypothetical protein